jgi:hypothetical protein
MSRSVHSTRNHHARERRFLSRDDEPNPVRLEEIEDEIRKKRRMKNQARRQRRGPLWEGLPPVDPEAIPIQVSDQGAAVHYPASPEDIRAIMRLLPPGVLTGLSGVFLSLGAECQSDDWRTEEGDPLVGRVGYENLPGVFGGWILGQHYSRTNRIYLYAYVYDPALPDREMWEVYLRLRMLITFVHEVAHHQDWTTRSSRDRWRMDNEKKYESYADTMQWRWAKEYVVPYLEAAYAEEVRRLGAWIRQHGGIDLPLAAFAEPPNYPFYTIYCAVESLAEEVSRDAEPLEKRSQFASSLWTAGLYSDALRAVAGILDEQPGHAEALCLRARALLAQEEYPAAEVAARQALRSDSCCVEAWGLLVRIHEHQKEWDKLLKAASTAYDLDRKRSDWWNPSKFLTLRAWANLKLGRLEDVARDVDTLVHGGRNH